MALQKEKTLLNGSTGNYWKITSEIYDKVTLECTWIIALFKDQSICDAGNPSLGLEKTYTYIATNEELAGDRTALGYTQIKLQAAILVYELPGDMGPSTPYDSDLIDTTDV